MLALGERNTQPISFYASLHQKVTEDEAGKNGIVCDEKGFYWDRYQIEHDGSGNSPSTDSTMTPEKDLIDCTDIDSLEISIKDVFNDIISKLKSKDENFIQGVSEFVQNATNLEKEVKLALQSLELYQHYTHLPPDTWTATRKPLKRGLGKELRCNPLQRGEKDQEYQGGEENTARQASKDFKRKIDEAEGSDGDDFDQFRAKSH